MIAAICCSHPSPSSLRRATQRMDSIHLIVLLYPLIPISLLELTFFKR